MNEPVLVLQHQTQDHPAYLRTWLEAHDVAHRVLDSERGQAYPPAIDGFGALAVLGGEYGANDDRPSLRDAERLIAQAFEREVPVLGHCLGGQLMARVLGAAVRPAPRPEIGWCEVRWCDGPDVAAWFGEPPPERVFQWHYDAFELPASAVLLAASDDCPHQAFALGPHLAMQFHVEVDERKLRTWMSARDPAYAAAQSAHPRSVQAPDVVRAGVRRWLPAQRRAAERVYSRWLGLGAH